MTIVKDIYDSIFSKDYTAIWQQFATENNGVFIVGKHDNHDSVEINYQNHKIIFDQYTDYRVIGGASHDTQFTRIRLEFISPDNLRLRIMRQGMIDSIGKIFGAQDIIVGDAEFDKKFVIKGNDEFKIQQIFSSETIKASILPHKDIVLQILDDTGIFKEKIQEGNSMLYYLSEHLVTTTEQLDTLFNLYKSLIDQLTKLGSARPLKASS